MQHVPTDEGILFSTEEDGSAPVFYETIFGNRFAYIESGPEIRRRMLEEMERFRLIEEALQKCEEQKPQLITSTEQMRIDVN